MENTKTNIIQRKGLRKHNNKLIAVTISSLALVVLQLLVMQKLMQHKQMIIQDNKRLFKVMKTMVMASLMVDYKVTKIMADQLIKAMPTKVMV